ncbi:hypothetical protein OUZ56_005717 [Daphnia magna]|uniref:Secreted protein n=1 Tax=Daphnia magna TaxID=35525 RepID=A0ABQ9YTJ1_9CRUS|nr:hypothetical protein OUZ56_005717 [Daphnia magna]
MALGGSILPVFVTNLGAFTASSSSITFTGNSPSNNSAPFGTSRAPSGGALWPFTMTTDGPSHPIRRAPIVSLASSETPLTALSIVCEWFVAHIAHFCRRMSESWPNIR